MDIERTVPNPDRNNSNKFEAICEKNDTTGATCYVENSVGSTAFYKCQACPFMALSEEKINYHIFTSHPSLSKQHENLKKVILKCPGCASKFNTDISIKKHLKEHHKMGAKDIKKLVKSLIRMELQTLNYNSGTTEGLGKLSCFKGDTQRVIELLESSNAQSNLPTSKGISVITLEELQKAPAPNLEKLDIKEMIKNASIVFASDEIPSNVIPIGYRMDEIVTDKHIPTVSSSTPDLISSLDINTKTAFNSESHSKSDGKTRILSNPEIDNHIAAKFSPKKATDTDNVESSVNKFPSDQKFSCSYANCYVQLQSTNDLSYHMRCHINGKLHCPECDRIFIYHEPLHTHLNKMHNVDIKLVYQERVCETIDVKKDTKENIRHKCGFCGKRFQTTKALLKHNLYHEVQSKVRSGEFFPSHIDNSINEALQNAKQLNDTAENSTEDVPLKCSYCEKEFKKKKAFLKHKLFHKPKDRPVCNVCSKDFFSLRHLRNHISSVHQKLKPFTCPECDFAASTNSALKLHVRSRHTDEKPHACDECSFKASDPNSLRRHKKKHTKQGYYKCSLCDYSCVQSTSFRIHLSSKHPDAEMKLFYKCPFCTYRFINKSQFITHISTHSDQDSMQTVLNELQSTKKKPEVKSIVCTEECYPEERKKDEYLENSDATASTKDNLVIPFEIENTEAINQVLGNYPHNVSHSTSYEPFSQTSKESTEENNSDCLLSENSSEAFVERLNVAQKSANNVITYNSININRSIFVEHSSSINVNKSVTNTNAIINLKDADYDNSQHQMISNFPLTIGNDNNSTLNGFRLPPINRIHLPGTKFMGPIIKPTQILPVSSQSSISHIIEIDGAPRKKPKISVKSNMILKGPDEENMFHSQQKLAFKRLEDNMNGPVTFNNLINQQFLPLSTESDLANGVEGRLGNILQFENLVDDTPDSQSDQACNDGVQIFGYNQVIENLDLIPSMNKNNIETSKASNNTGYIKMESKQSMQSPSVESMYSQNPIICNNRNLLNEYCKTSPPPDLTKNDSEIKREIKSDIFNLENKLSNPQQIAVTVESSSSENITVNSDIYGGHIDLMVLPDIIDNGSNQVREVIEIDDNSLDNKQLPRLDSNMTIESYYANYDFQFLDNDHTTPNSNEFESLRSNLESQEVNQIYQSNEIAGINMIPPYTPNNFLHLMHSKKDPMMNTCTPSVPTKINVKNIELMKSNEHFKSQ